MRQSRFLIFILTLCFIAQIALANMDKVIESQDDEELEDFKFLFFREDCMNEFLNLNFFYKDCISITMSKGLGYGIILGASAVKLPQIFNIVRARSGEGILPSMFYIECLMFIINGCYNIHLESPFSVYGENFCLLLQNVFIIYLLWKYNSSSSTKSNIILSVSILIVFGILLTDIIVPSVMWNIFMDLQILLVAYSRMPQIIENFKNSSTGELSSLMFLLNACGNVARTFTFIKETQDMYNMFTSGLSALLNFTIFLQVVYYWKVNNQKHQ
jgi:mannose-P-dolichol utilization defect 1